MSQLLTFLTLALLARMYPVETLGRFSYFLQLAALFTIIANGKYEFTILVSETRRKAIAAFQLCTIVNAIVCIALLLICLSINEYLLLPLYVFLSALPIACSYWFNFNKRLSLIARYSIVQSICANSMKYLTGILRPCMNGLLWADISGFIIGTCSCFTQKRLYTGLFRFHWNDIKELALKYRHYPCYVLPLSLINTLSVTLPVLLPAIHFDMEKIGFLSMALTLTVPPVRLWASSLDQAVSRAMTECIQNKHPLSVALKRIILKLLLWLVPATIVTYFLIPPAIGLLLGDAWRETGKYIQLLLPALAAWLLTLSFTSIPNLSGKQQKALVLEIIFIGCRASTLLLGVWHDDLFLCIALYSAMSVLIAAIQIFWYIQIAPATQVFPQ